MGRRRQIAVLSMVIRVELNDKITFKQKCEEGDEEVSYMDILVKGDLDNVKRHVTLRRGITSVFEEHQGIQCDWR